MWLMLAGLAGVCGGGCRGEDLTAPRGAAAAPARVLVVADTLCVRAQFTITGPTTVTTNFPTTAECPGGLRLIRSQPATWAQTPNRRLRLFVRITNLTGQAVQLPVRLYLPANGTTVVLPAGTPPSKVVAYQPDSSEAGGGRVWFIGGTSVLAAGDSTAEDTLTFQVQSPVTKARFQFQATAATNAVVPPAAPESVSTAIWVAMHASSNMVVGDPRFGMPFPRNTLTVQFHGGVSQALRQAAIAAVGGTVVGGTRIGEDEGYYYVQIQDDGTATPLFNAVALLKAMPQVRDVGPEVPATQITGPLPMLPPSTRWPQGPLLAVPPTDTTIRYYRNLLGILFDSTATNAEFTNLQVKYGAALLGGIGAGTPNRYYVLQFPDPGASLASLEALAAQVRLEPGVLEALQLTYGAIRIRGRFPSDTGLAPNRSEWTGSATAPTRPWPAAREPLVLESVDEDTLTFQVQAPVTKARWQIQGTGLDAGGPLPPNPNTTAVPDDSLQTIVSPVDTAMVYFRTMAQVQFRSGTTGSDLAALLQKFQATIVGGTLYSATYIIRYPDPGNSWSAFLSRLDSVAAEPIVLRAMPMTRSEGPPLVDGRRTGDADDPVAGRPADGRPATLSPWRTRATSHGPGADVPPLPPDSIASATWLALHDTLNLEPASAAYPIPFPRNLILLTFRENTPLNAKQAAIDAIGGEVVGGSRIGNGGVYYVTIFGYGTTTPLFNAIAQLKALPQVLLATPELVPLSPARLYHRAAMTAADTARPPIPTSTVFPYDSSLTVSPPGDTATHFFRNIFAIKFDDSTSGLTVLAFFQTFGATIIAGGPAAREYYVWTSDPGPTWQAYDQLHAAMDNAVGVRYAAAVSYRGPIGFNGTHSSAVEGSALVPALPPDSIPTWVLADSSIDGNGYTKQLIEVLFQSSATQPERQAALQSVDGTVIGGLPMTSGDGYYLVQVPDDGSGAQLDSAVVHMTMLPAVRHVGRQWRGGGPLPANPDHLMVPDDSLETIRGPLDTVVTYYRTMAQVQFKPGSTGGGVATLLQKYQAQIVGGVAFSGVYVLRYADPGNSWSSVMARVDSLAAEPIVLRAMPMTRSEGPPLIE